MNIKTGRNIIILLLGIISSYTFAEPDTLIVLNPGKSIDVDGIIGSEEWADADSLIIEIEENWISTVYSKCDGSHISFAFKDLEKVSGRAHVVDLFFDKSNNKSISWDSDDLWIHASFNDCEAIGNYYVWSSCSKTKSDWLANNLPFTGGYDNIEIQINISKLNIESFPDTIGLGISVNEDVDNYWPDSADIAVPSTWGYLVLPELESSVIPDHERKDNIVVSPNPGSGIFTLVLSEYISLPVEIRLYSIDGRQIYLQNVKSGRSNLDLSVLNKGTYILKVAGTVQNEKVVIE